MITDEGKLVLKRYLAGEVGSIASSIGFGLGSRSAAGTDTHLQFEFERADVTLTSYDFVNDKVVFKALLPPDFAGTVYEVGLWTMEQNDLAGEYGSKLLVTFDSDSETWTNATWTTSSTRVGTDSLSHTPGVSATVTSTLSEVFIDLLGNSGADKFLLAYNNGNANCSSITIRFKTDSSNYYSFTISDPPTGYQIAEILKSAAATNGSPDWENITSVDVITTSKATGSSSVNYDGLRIEDMDTINPDYVLVSRQILGTPYTKVDGRAEEIEIYLAVTVG